MIKEFNVSKIFDYNKVFDCLEDVLRKKKIVLLKGELGAGKTTFVKEYIKYKNDVSDQELAKLGFSSPTFTIENQYEINNDLILHFDFYRLKENEYDLEDHIEDFEYAKVVFIEWAEKIGVKELFSDSDWVEVLFLRKEDQKRVVQFINY